MSKPRSIDQHRRFFAVIKATHDQWPESHPFQPDNTEHLRSWLLVRAGHHTVKTFHLDGDGDEFARLIPVIVATMLNKHAWCRAHGQELHVCVPESIAFDKLDHKAFCILNDNVDEVIRIETGLDPDRLLRETESAS